MKVFVFCCVLIVVCACEHPNNLVQTPPQPECGCKDTFAYNYSSEFLCNDTTKCYYPSDRLSGTYAGTSHYQEISQSGDTIQFDQHPDTIIIVKGTSNTANVYSNGLTGNYFTVFNISKSGADDIHFQFAYSTIGGTGDLIDDEILSYGAHGTNVQWLYTMEQEFNGTRID